MPIQLQNSVVYGPLESRRFGKSLGINLLPTEAKACTFDCLYCQYGETQKQPMRFPDLATIKKEVESAFSQWALRSEAVDNITIAGNGEPTLHPQFPEVVKLLTAARDRFLPDIPIGILSNSSTCHRTEIADSLLDLDARFMKLDAGGPDVFHLLNRPFSRESWSQMIGGLYHLRKLVIQSMFVSGSADNTSEETLEEWMIAIGYIGPESVQVYTIQRSPSDSEIVPVLPERLIHIAKTLTARTKVPATVYA